MLPPKLGLAVSNTVPPAHTVVPGAAVIFTAGVRIVVITMWRWSVAVSGRAQILLLTILHFTISPLAGV